MHPFDADRYARQVRFAALGPEGQAKLASARVAVVGCGALGSVVTLALARAGIGHLRLIDRDVPEISNLPRQVLFDDADVRAGLPKSVAAARQMERVHSGTVLEPLVADLTATTADRLLSGVDLIIDGSDTFETRFLINDFSCSRGIPWVHGGAIGAEGRVLTILPGRTACLRCLIPDPPEPGALPTCETAGVLGTAALVVGAVEANEAIRLLAGDQDRLGNRLFVCDLWAGHWRSIDLGPLAAEGCPTCRGGDYPWLEGRSGGQVARICGREAVQVGSAGGGVDLERLGRRLADFANLTTNAWMVRAEVEPGIVLSVFADGRSLVAGTHDETRARAIVARYLG
jgi:molybdopterin/thiamine biosynthesis adenylyltransferase